MFLKEKSAVEKPRVSKMFLSVGSLSYLETPTFPNVRVLGSSGRMQTLFFLCSGFLIQSSQNERGHLTLSSSQSSLLIIQPKPGKKSER